MSAGAYNILIDQGAQYALQVQWLGSNGAPINITGWSAQMMIRQSYLDANALLTLSSPSNGLTITGSTGTVSVAMTGQQTAALPPDVTCYYDLLLTDPSGNLTRLIQGTVYVSPAITWGG